MRSAETPDRERIALRLWPGVALVAVQWLVRFVAPLVDPALTPLGVLAGLALGLALGVWWLFFSRAPWSDRGWGVALVGAGMCAVWPLLHVSIATGMQGLMYPVYAIPVVSLAFTLWALAARRLAALPRYLALAASVLAACLPFALVRTGGFTSDLHHDLAWRWSRTPGDLLLLEASDEAEAPAAPEATLEGGTALWPGFRGPLRDGVVHGSRVDPDWAASPPRELWRRAIGPGWSSFAVDGARFFTQEQRGEDEVVSCYELASGHPLWRHADATRFWESNAGAGPRGTPTLHEGRLYTLGATGILNALDAADGSLVWSRDAAADTGAELPGWGFAGSPLVVGELVVVATAGALVAYDRASGEPHWNGPTRGSGYSSPQLAEIDGQEQIVFLSEGAATGIAPADGTRLWEHVWDGEPIVQPNRTADGDVLISLGERNGVRRLAIAREGDGWSVRERWTSTSLKPFFNDFVVHAGHAYGFDSGILACIDLATGERAWKGGRYGQGQLVLLADQDLLLVLSEHGEVALVTATPEDFEERARFPAIEGKTWNHPVLAGDVLLVRNAEEMAAYRLTLLSE